MPRHVVGLDGCPSGWVAVVLRDGAVVDVRVVPDVTAALGRRPVTVAIDIPVGLLDVPREADGAARRRLPGRAASVFSAPPRCVVEGYLDGSLPDHATATARAVAVTGRGISMQTWRLVTKVAEVDALRAAGRELLEVHPEVAFATVLGEVPPRKASWPGLAVRRAALAELGVVLPDRFEGDERAAPDDVVDAAICAWVADGAAAGAPLVELPWDGDQRDGGHRVRIVARPRPGVPSRP